MQFRLFCSIYLLTICLVATINISCYQCKRNGNSECLLSDLQPCMSNQDICVTHISKMIGRDPVIKRECGTSPCRFDNELLNRKFGIDSCERNKKEYFCFSCCNYEGCNKNCGLTVKSTIMNITMALLLLYLFFN